MTPPRVEIECVADGEPALDRGRGRTRLRHRGIAPRSAELARAADAQGVTIPPRDSARNALAPLVARPRHARLRRPRAECQLHIVSRPPAAPRRARCARPRRSRWRSRAPAPGCGSSALRCAPSRASAAARRSIARSTARAGAAPGAAVRFQQRSHVGARSGEPLAQAASCSVRALLRMRMRRAASRARQMGRCRAGRAMRSPGCISRRAR